MLPENPRSCWRTPKEIFGPLNVRFGFTLDAAADGHNALCPEWIDRGQNALNTAWHGRAVFGNPPYSGPRAAKGGTFLPEAPLRQWMQHAHDQAAQGNAETVVMLVACQPANRWFADFAQLAQEVIFPTPRIEFDAPAALVDSSDNRGDNAIFVFGRHVRRVGAWWWHWQTNVTCTPPTASELALERRVHELESAVAVQRANWDAERRGMQEIIADLKRGRLLEDVA